MMRSTLAAVALAAAFSAQAQPVPDTSKLESALARHSFPDGRVVYPQDAARFCSGIKFAAERAVGKREAGMSLQAYRQETYAGVPPPEREPERSLDAELRALMDEVSAIAYSRERPSVLMAGTMSERACMKVGTRVYDAREAAQAAERAAKRAAEDEAYKRRGIPDAPPGQGLDGVIPK
jgi:hypothetical protein